MTLIIQIDKELTGRLLAIHIMTASERSSAGDAKISSRDLCRRRIRLRSAVRGYCVA